LSLSFSQKRKEPKKSAFIHALIIFKCVLELIRLSANSVPRICGYTHGLLRKTSTGRAWQAPSYKQKFDIAYHNRKPEYALCTQTHTEAFPQFRMSGFFAALQQSDLLLTYQLLFDHL
jgi:hypothetical protein